MVERDRLGRGPSFRLNVLLATRRRAQLEEGSVRVVRASPRVLRMISLLGLKRAFALE